MKSIRILPYALVLVLVGGAIAGCSRGPSEAELALAELQTQFAAIQEQNDSLKQIQAELAALVPSVEEIEVIDEAKRTDEQKMLLEEATAKINELTANQDSAFEQLQGNIAAFLNTALNDFPEAPETKQVLDIYSEEAIVVAEDIIAKAGDYKKATDHLAAAASLYEQAGLVAYQPLLDKVQWLDDWRFITQERFDEVKKKMTKDEVRIIAGVPYYQNIQEDTKRGVETWLYRKREGGAAAIYFKMKTGKVYDKKFDVVKTKVVE